MKKSNKELVSCKRCHKKLLRTSGNQKYCPRCAVMVNREKQRIRNKAKTSHITVQKRTCARRGCNNIFHPQTGYNGSYQPRCHRRYCSLGCAKIVRVEQMAQHHIDKKKIDAISQTRPNKKTIPFPSLTEGEERILERDRKSRPTCSAIIQHATPTKMTKIINEIFNNQRVYIPINRDTSVRR